MLYDRKIKYLDYYEGGSKINGGGFAKLEVRDNILRIELMVRGLHPTDSFERDIVLQGAEKEETLGQIRIQNGYGQFRYSCDADKEIGATGISYSELRGIRISIGGTREILCQWDNVSDKRRITPQEENFQKSKSGLQEPKRESAAESHTGNKADFEALLYSENEQNRKLKSEKVEEKLKEAQKEGFESIKDEDKENKNRENKNAEGSSNVEGNNVEDSNVEGKNVGGGNAEGGNLESKNVGGSNAEGGNVESKNAGGSNAEGGNLESINVRDSNVEDNNREDRNQADKNREGKDKEMQAQGATMLSSVMSSQFTKSTPKTGLQPEERSGDQTEDKSATAGNNRAEQPAMKKAPVKLMEDKWQQLSAIYPHIQPFRDERDYLSLTPSDFVLFPDRFYRAVNNSFLLHGYYNYHHLILARIERRGEIVYYIGVPGNYFEREKQVAIMFGFESFECETESAKTGDFGYYMMRTEL